VQTNASKGDFATDTRLLRITTIAAVVGMLGTFAADFLLYLIRFFTNVFFFQTLSIACRSSPMHPLIGWSASCRATISSNLRCPSSTRNASENDSAGFRYFTAAIPVPPNLANRALIRRFCRYLHA
jgi:hypothetical protein